MNSHVARAHGNVRIMVLTRIFLPLTVAIVCVTYSSLHDRNTDNPDSRPTQRKDSRAYHEVEYI